MTENVGAHENIRCAYRRDCDCPPNQCRLFEAEQTPGLTEPERIKLAKAERERAAMLRLKA